MFAISARSRARRRGRLLAACTTGAMAAGAFALGPAGVASADSGAPRHVTHVVPRSAAQPTFTLQKHKKSSYATAAGTALKTPRYDYDGDGYSDLLVQNGNHSVAVLSSAKITQGQKGYTELGTPSVMYRSIVTPGNLTGSSVGDEVLGLTESGRLNMFSIDGLINGTPIWTGNGWQIYNQVVAVGDTNGDGWGDLLARTPSGDLYLYKGTGNASAPLSARINVGHGYGIYDQLTGAGDITGTGHETLVARDLNGDLWMYQLDGTAASPLAARVKIGTGWNIYNQLIGWGDDNASTGQLMGRTLNGTLYWYNGDGSGKGTLTPRVVQGNGWTNLSIADQGHGQQWAKNDLLGQTSSGNLYYYYSLNTGVLSARQQLGTSGGWKGTRLLSPVSLTDEGWDPLLEIYQGTLYNDSDNGSTVSTGWGSYNLTVGPGDLSGDGNSDILARDSSGVLWNYTGRGNGLLYGRVKVGGGWNGYNAIIGAGDIDGDGKADIVARDGSNGHLYIYKGTGVASAPFKARVDIGGGWNGYIRLAAPGDLDGDGRADIVGVNSAGELYRYSGSGHNTTATFKPRVKIGTAGWNGYSSVL
jgi:hypothetical protein